MLNFHRGSLRSLISITQRSNWFASPIKKRILSAVTSLCFRHTMMTIGSSASRSIEFAKFIRMVRSSGNERPGSKLSIRQVSVRRLNAAIEQALRVPDKRAINHLRQASRGESPTSLAERVRRCATRLLRRDRSNTKGILQVRDQLILGIYAAATPPGWYVGWCDGSSKSTAQGPVASVGGLLLDSRGQAAGQLSRRVEALSAFEAEIAALQALVGLATETGAQKLLVHTDCIALVRLWHCHRNDPRLLALRQQVRPLRGFRLRQVPRSHNQSAHRLARCGLPRSA